MMLYLNESFAKLLHLKVLVYGVNTRIERTNSTYFKEEMIIGHEISPAVYRLL